MKAEDYKTTNQARDYQYRRFGNGLLLVSQDEISLLDSWLSLISASQSNSYLDLGAGTGRITGELLRRKPRMVYALDTSAAMLTLLQKNHSREIKKQKLKILSASSNEIPLESASIDLITAFHLFKHLPDINPTLKEAYRVLKPGGYLIFDVLNKNSLVRLHLGTCYALSQTSIKNKLGKNSFKIIEMSPLNIFGETAYNFPIPILVYNIDKLFSRLTPKFATKFFVLAQKL
ncbi:MAG: class I SAM-dependent methyltransferase [bacterium]|nr:class I SAM-dependent methyltransferase [bacterium]